MYFLLYLVLMCLFIGVMTMLNTKIKWITKKDFETDVGVLVFILLLCAAFWPVALLSTACYYLCKWIYTKIIPDENLES
jgi:hypothetical protein